MNIKKLFPKNKSFSFKFSDIGKPQSFMPKIGKQQSFSQLTKGASVQKQMQNKNFSFKFNDMISFTPKQGTAQTFSQLTGASVPKQQQWKNMPAQNKVLERMLRKDKDMDFTPDKFDCEPNNPEKQDKWRKDNLLKGVRHKYRMVNLTDIIPSEEREHASKKKIAQIEQSGEIQKPINLHNKYDSNQKYQIYDGHHRFYAANERGDKQIPARISESLFPKMYYREKHKVSPFLDKTDWKNTFSKKAPELQGRDTTQLKNRVQPTRQTNFVDLQKTSLHPDQMRLSGASPEKQQEWQNMPKEEKVLERIEKPDIDKDNVPDSFDCEPKNPDKQDFTPETRGWKRNDEGMTAAQKFGQRNLDRLKKLGQGRDRAVYALDKDKVLKIARSPGGTNQNMLERDLDNVFGHVKHHETGKDYVVMERAAPAGSAVSKMFRKVKAKGGSSYGYGYDGKRKLVDSFYDAGYEDLHSDLSNYDIAPGDILKRSSWGEKNGEPVLIDAGGLNATSLQMKYNPISGRSGFAAQDIQEYEDIKRERKMFKNKGREPVTVNKGRGVILEARAVPPQYHGGESAQLKIKYKRGGTDYNAYPKDVKIDNPKQLEIRNDNWDKERMKAEATENAFKALDNTPSDKLMGDTDKDGVVNAMDCEPNNPEKQGPFDQMQPDIRVGGMNLDVVDIPKKKVPFTIVQADNTERSWEDMEDEILNSGENIFRRTTAMNKLEKAEDIMERADVVYPLNYGGLQQWSANIRTTDLDGVDTPENSALLQEFYEQGNAADEVISMDYLQLATEFIHNNPEYFVGLNLNEARRLIAEAIENGQDPILVAQQLQAGERDTGF